MAHARVEGSAPHHADPAATLSGVAAIVLWSSLALLTTLTGGLPPFLVLSCCFGFAALAGLARAALAGRAGWRAMRTPPAAFAATTLALFGYHALYFFSLKHAPPVEASLVNYLWPLLIVLFSALLPGVRLRAGNVVGALLGLAAAALLVTGGRGLSVDPAHAAGYAAAFAAALTWGGYSVLNRRFAGIDSAAIVPACGVVALLGAAMHVAFEAPAAVGTAQWWVLAAMGIGPTGLAFRLWDRGTKHGDLALLGSLSYLAPLLSTLLLVLAGRAEAHWIQAVAVALLLAGAWTSVHASRGRETGGRAVNAMRALRRFALPALLLAATASLAFARKPADPADAMARRDEALVAKAVAALPRQRPDAIDLYAIGVAGDGTENVFRNETEYFAALMQQRLHARGVLTLVSNPASIHARPQPLATYDNLYDAVMGVARRMDRRQDVLLLYLTMHGTPEHELALYDPPYVDDVLVPDDLRFLLDKAGIRNRVIVISACYSGGFIPALRNDDTLLLTAARGDRPSFGCGADSSATFFGRAWLVEGLNHTADFAGAFRQARTRIAHWEQVGGIEASHPQIAEGKAIATRLAQWRARTPPGPALAYPWPLDDLDAPADAAPVDDASTPAAGR